MIWPLSAAGALLSTLAKIPFLRTILKMGPVKAARAVLILSTAERPRTPGYLGPIVGIIRRDVAALLKNPVSIVMTLGLVLLPALYAWFITLGFWSPYENTGGIKVAVANVDEGYALTTPSIDIHVGDDIVSKLHESTRFDWQFVSEQEAVTGVDKGTYYAAFVIPSTFSADLASAFRGTAEDGASITYYVNQAENAIAPRITDEGATDLQRQVDEEVMRTVSTTALDVAADALSLTGDSGLAAYGSTALQRIGTAIEQLEAAAATLTAVGRAATTTAQLADDATNALSTLGWEASSLGDQISRARSDISEARGNAEKTLGSIYDDADEAAGNDAPTDEVITRLEQVEKLASAMEADATRTATSINSAALALEGTGTAISSDLRDLTSLAQTTADDLLSISAALRDAHDQLSDALDSQGASALADLAQGEDARRAALLAAPVQIDRHAIYAVNGNGSAMSPFYTTLCLWIGSVFLIALMNVSAYPETLRAAGSEHGAASQAAGKEARQAARQEAGDASTGRKRRRRARRQSSRNELPTPAQLYLGRYGVFALLALTQAGIVCAGNLLFLNVQCEHPGLYILTACTAAIVFSCITYTLAVSFGSIGKALAVVLLVLQLSGSGGIFPVQMSGELFQRIHPLLPSSYTLDALQSCVAGIYSSTDIVAYDRWNDLFPLIDPLLDSDIADVATLVTDSNVADLLSQALASEYWRSMLKLVAFLVPTLMVGLVLRRPLINLNRWVEERTSETGLLR